MHFIWLFTLHKYFSLFSLNVVHETTSRFLRLGLLSVILPLDLMSYSVDKISAWGKVRNLWVICCLFHFVQSRACTEPGRRDCRNSDSTTMLTLNDEEFETGWIFALSSFYNLFVVKMTGLTYRAGTGRFQQIIVELKSKSDPSPILVGLDIWNFANLVVLVILIRACLFNRGRLHERWITLSTG